MIISNNLFKNNGTLKDCFNSAGNAGMVNDKFYENLLKIKMRNPTPVERVEIFQRIKDINEETLI